MTLSADSAEPSEIPIHASVENWIDRLLQLLRSTMQTHGVSQLSVQESLGWGRTYISQLLRKQKALRFDQVLMILETLGIEPQDFFAELFGLPAQAGPKHLTAKDRRYLDHSLDHSIQSLREGHENLTVKEFRATVRALVLHITTLGGAPLHHFVETYRHELQLDGLLREDTPKPSSNETEGPLKSS